MLAKRSMAKLPLKELAYLFDIMLNYGSVRLIGGCVRDIISGRAEIKDCDLATSILPHDLLKILAAHNIKSLLTGVKYGTITVLVGDAYFEVTTLRRDIECDGRYAEVAFTDDWQADAARRDFTINALSMDLQGQIYDYFDGIPDLQSKVVRFIGSPAERIKEDHLRILRYFRFCAYFGIKMIDQPSLEAAINYASSLQRISGERIRSEMLKILSAPFSHEVLPLMFDSGVSEVLGFIGVSPGKLKALRYSVDPIVNLVALLLISQQIETAYETIVARWRLSRLERKAIKTLCECWLQDPISLQDSIKLHQQRICKIGIQLYIKLLQVAQVLWPGQGYHMLEKDIVSMQILPPPVRGEDLKEVGLRGKQIGEALQKAKLLWIEHNFSLSKQELLQMVV